MTSMDTTEKIQKLMAARGLESQALLGRKLGLHPSKVSRFINGIYELKAIEWVRLARELGVSVDYLLDPAREQPDDELTREDWAVVLMARSLGHPEAIARLMRAAGDPGGGTAKPVQAAPSIMIGGGESRVADGPGRSRPPKKA